VGFLIDQRAVSSGVGTVPMMDILFSRTTGFGWDDLTFALVTGIVATALWAAGAWVLRRRRLRTDFGPYAGTYIQRRKFPTPGVPETEIVKITVHQNVLRVEFEERPKRSISGEIVMNEQLPTSGEGHYDDVKDQKQLWGFWAAQIKDKNTILVHTTYASTIDTAVLQGYVWERRPAQCLATS